MNSSQHSPTAQSVASTTKPKLWTAEEHAKFLDALKLYGKDYQQISAYVESRTPAQVKSHTQKFMQALAKSDTEADQQLLKILNVNMRVLSFDQRNAVREASALVVQP